MELHIIFHIIFALLAAIAQAQSTASSTLSMSSIFMMSNVFITTTASMSTIANVSVAEYTITALPAVQSQASCVFNCLIPIGLADPSGCDDVTNQCACLNAPMDALDVLTDCIQTVCQSSTRSYAALATSLYESYCQSVFGVAQFSQAFTSEAAAAASSLMASTGSSKTATVTVTATTTPSASSTKASSGSVTRKISSLASVFSLLAGLFFLIAL